MSSCSTSSASAPSFDRETVLVQMEAGGLEIHRLREEIEEEKRSAEVYSNRLWKFRDASIAALHRVLKISKRNDVLQKNNSSLRLHSAKMAKIIGKIVQGYNPAELARLSSSVLSSLEEDEDMPPLPGRARNAGEGAGEGAGESAVEWAGESAAPAIHKREVSPLELLLEGMTASTPDPPPLLTEPGAGSVSASLRALMEETRRHFSGASSGSKTESTRHQHADMRKQTSDIIKKLRKEIEIDEEGEEIPDELDFDELAARIQKKSDEVGHPVPKKKVAVKRSAPATPPKNLELTRAATPARTLFEKRKVKKEPVEADCGKEAEVMKKENTEKKEKTAKAAAGKKLSIIATAHMAAGSKVKAAIPTKKKEFSLARVKQEWASDVEE